MTDTDICKTPQNSKNISAEHTADIYTCIETCVQYALKNGLCMPEDEYYVRNGLLALFKLDAPQPVELAEIPQSIAETYEQMTNYAAEQGLLELNTPVYREIFDNQIGDRLLMPPSQVISLFNEYYKKLGPQAATDWFYSLCRNSNYIRTAEIARNIFYKAPCEYGEAEITINLTKPEKDPQEIARQAAAKQLDYPKCQLCIENEGYAGRINHPPRRLLRTIPLTLNNEDWYFQYSPYVYFNEHCIAFSKEHTPMEINRATFERLFDFLEIFPHYFIGSNAGLPIAGGSILSHLHFQGGRYQLPMMKADKLREFASIDPEVSLEQLHWPMPALHLSGTNRKAVAEYAEKITLAWESYSDPDLGILARTDSPHNTITPIARLDDGIYTLDLVLRNNRTNDQFPLGIFHPHPCRHHIKRENIGLIEVMGLFILPGRLKEELAEVAKYIEGKEYNRDKIEKHRQWADSFKEKYAAGTPNGAQELIRLELAKLCMLLLSDAAVYKDTSQGQAGLEKFLTSCGLIKQ